MRFPCATTRSTATFRGPMPVLHVHDLDLVRAIMVSDASECFGARYRRPIAGENDYVNKTLPLLHGDQWRVLRKIVHASFSPAVVQERFAYADQAVAECVKQLEGRVRAFTTEGGRLDVRV